MPDNQHEPHDANFEWALTSGLKDQPALAHSCPDAETLAAFCDQTLSPDEQRFWEAHCAACSRCQAHLAALAHTSPVFEEDLAEPRASPRFAWLTDWRWLAPVATAAVVLLAVWGVNPESPTDRQTPTVGDADLPAAATEMAQGDIQYSQSASPDRQDFFRRVERESVAPEADGPLARDEASMLDQVAAGEPTDAGAQRANPRSRASTSAPPAELAERRLARPPQEARSAGAARSADLPETSGVVDVVSVDGSIRWRLLPPSRVERSADGGATWTLQLSDAGAMMTAGAAPSASVCWIVGRGGTILLTIDGGETWERVTAPRPVDLIGVEAVDTRSARIDAIDGVSFRTVDGGLTWECERNLVGN